LLDVNKDVFNLSCTQACSDMVIAVVLDNLPQALCSTAHFAYLTFAVWFR